MPNFTSPMIDASILKWRQVFHASRIESVAMHCLQKINDLQRLRFKVIGSYLPANNGKYYYLDLDRGKWFEFKNTNS